MFLFNISYIIFYLYNLICCSPQLQALTDYFFCFSFLSKEKQSKRISFLPFIYICFLELVFISLGSPGVVLLRRVLVHISIRKIRFEENQKPEFETLFDLLVFTGSPTVPPSEMTTEANTDKEGGILGAQQGNRKTEGAAETFF